LSQEYIYINTLHKGDDDDDDDNNNNNNNNNNNVSLNTCLCQIKLTPLGLHKKVSDYAMW